jgi:hypothetical protein
MMTSWSFTVRVVRMLKSAPAAIRIKQPDSYAKDLQPDGEAHGAASERQETGPIFRPSGSIS